MNADRLPRFRSGVLPALLVTLLTLHGGLRAQTGLAHPAESTTLPAAPPVSALRILSLGDPIALARALMIWIHTHENHAGHALPLRTLDYDRLANWLQRCLELDPVGQAPLAAASQLYAHVDDPLRSRRMLRLISRAYTQDPTRRWRWQMRAIQIARLQLHDEALAEALTRTLITHAHGAMRPASSSAGTKFSPP